MKLAKNKNLRLGCFSKKNKMLLVLFILSIYKLFILIIMNYFTNLIASAIQEFISVFFIFAVPLTLITVIPY